VLLLLLLEVRVLLICPADVSAVAQGNRHRCAASAFTALPQPQGCSELHGLPRDTLETPQCTVEMCRPFFISTSQKDVFMGCHTAKKICLT
jgi:hypothetical protein